MTILKAEDPSTTMRKYHPQFGPLEVNPRTGELFLRLRKHKDIILTPPRPESDPHDLVKYLNEEIIYKWLDMVPTPYTLADGEWFLDQITPPANETIAQLDHAAQSNLQTPIKVGRPPVRYLRHLQYNTEGEEIGDVLIGDIGITRTERGELFTIDGELRDGDEVDWEGGKKAVDEMNLGEGVGSPPTVIWEPGYWLAPAYHGQGIMPDALNTLIYDWCIPRMGARRFLGLTGVGNEKSSKVFTKNGFVQKKVCAKYRKDKRGNDTGLVAYELILDT